mmetsp:Transcript_19278/g.28525  ORF Transcript_19278/g.28525 Transcript_19278/m.28525 type:complete len:354 (+) Transcript_19278:124-1185(+)
MNYTMEENRRTTHSDIHFLHQYPNESRRSFPSDCLPIVRLMKGNSTCVDCNEKDRDLHGHALDLMYGSIAYGTLLCQTCAEHHKNSYKTMSWSIKSLESDQWSFDEVLSLLEGGNAKFRDFCATSISSAEQQDVYKDPQLKTYRAHVIDAVDKAQEDRKALVTEEEENYQQRQQVPTKSESIDCKSHDDKLYGNEAPMMTLVDFQMSLIGNELHVNKNEIQCHSDDQEEREEVDVVSLLDDEWEYDPFESSSELSMYSNDNKRFVKELPILSVADFYTSVLGKEWPVEDNETERTMIDDQETNSTDGAEDNVKNEWKDYKALCRPTVPFPPKEECIITLANMTEGLQLGSTAA